MIIAVIDMIEVVSFVVEMQWLGNGGAWSRG